MVRFKLVTVDYQDYDTDYIGISKDTSVRDALPTYNYGASSLITLGYGTGVEDEVIGVIEIQMPEEADVIGSGSLFKVEIGFYIQIAGSATPTALAIYNLPQPDENWLEGEQTGAAGYCNYEKRDVGVNWSNLADHSKLFAPDENAVDGISAGPSQGFVWFDITHVIGWGDKKSFYIRNLIDLLNKGISFASRESATPANHPILRVQYRSYPPDGFTGDDEKLKIEPYENNFTQSKLTWGAMDTDDFLQYKLYRDTSPITTIDGFKSAITVAAIATDKFTIAGDHTPAFPVGSTFKVSGSTANDGRWTVVGAVYTGGNTVIEVSEDITDATADGYIHHGIWTSINPASEEFIDTFAHVDNSTYYYKLIAEDQDNHEDDALLSAPVFFTKPDVTTATVTPATPNDVGTLHTITVVSPQNIKKIYVDWNDGSTSWYEFEEVGVSKTATHIYSKVGTFTAQVRVQDELGFWSALQSANAMVIDDTAPIAEVMVSVKKALEGDWVTLNASMSQPMGSNITITTYKFWRYAGDPTPTTQASPVFSFSTAGFGTGTITATVEITTSSARTDTDTVTYDLESGTPTDITPGVTGGLSINTKIHELPHKLARSKLVEASIDGAGVEYEFDLGRKAERFTIHATTHYPSMQDDITLIRNAWLNNTYLRLLIPSEMERRDVQYDFMMDGDVELGHNYDNMISWSFPVRVIARTESLKPLAKGDITAFADGGAGKVQMTSAAHGLSVGMFILITETINYNGTYEITNITVNTVKFVATWVANDAMGLWRKVGVS